MTIDDDYMLSTYDNPFNPFDDFLTWFKQDLLLGHNCCSIIDENAFTSPSFTDSRNEQEIDKAVDWIIKSEPTIYRKVYRKDFERNNKTINS